LAFALGLIALGPHTTCKLAAQQQGFGNLEARLLAMPPAQLASRAVAEGDAARGAIVFHQPTLACSQCHAVSKSSNISIGPSLVAAASSTPAAPPSSPPSNTPSSDSDTSDSRISDIEIVEAVLRPSARIAPEYQTTVVLTVDGVIIQGRLVSKEDGHVEILDAANNFLPVKIDRDQIESETRSPNSLMPAGQMNALTSVQQFLDLIKYLIEIRDGGERRAAELQPAPAMYAAAPLPEYENHIDHAGLIRGWDKASLQRGEAIYSRVCANCHGTLDQPGSLPTSLRFASGKFKNGFDPYSMYQTLTRGFGMMVPQPWMVPEQKYDVIHYIRETYLKDANRSQFLPVTEDYLASLPEGDSRGPEPVDSQPWEEMNYGPNLVATYEIGKDGSNFAYKGNAVRLDPGPGGVSRGNFWSVFDFDTLRMAGVWSGEQFIDYNGINFNGQHNIHPRVAGTVAFETKTGPGWARPGTDSFEDPRLIGRDGRRYGPLPRSWAQYRGMYHHGNETIIAYTVGDTSVLECQGPRDDLRFDDATGPVAWRQFEIGPRQQDLLLRVADDAALANQSLVPVDTNLAGSMLHNVHRWGESYGGDESSDAASGLQFRGRTFLQIDPPEGIDLEGGDYTIAARLRTADDGTIFCQTMDQDDWVPNGKSLFIRDGRLVFDIGWVGAVESDVRVADDRWHDVVMTYTAADHRIQFHVDQQPAGGGRLETRQPLRDPVLRIGKTADNFPDETMFRGDLQYVSLVPGVIPAKDFAMDQPDAAVPDVAHATTWIMTAVGDQSTIAPAGGSAEAGGNTVDGEAAEAGAGAVAKIIRGDGDAGASIVTGPIVVGIATAGPQSPQPSDWESQTRWETQGEKLTLRIPAGGQTLRFILWMTRPGSDAAEQTTLESLRFMEPSRDLAALTEGGPPRWTGEVTTDVVMGNADGPFAVDVLSYPLVNPWLCRMRLTGHDFFADGDRAAVCDWDGNVWLVAGLSQIDHNPQPKLSWKRIASGLFQPLGLKIIDESIYVTCRDQLCRLHDLNQDDVIDWYQCINNDHQVTDHFHEFAMGLQTDADGNFYYAKSARHALPALVPHHGTLLKISRDGETTEILATGFRAANGVCLNPDGSFIVTDQEGHWNPKNRINWVQPGGFYGNMYGYHDVTDSSDDAMQQPLCWITNAMDRSPAELLWVDSDRWGPLENQLLNLSYGYGKVFLVPHEKIAGLHQGGMVELPIPQFPTGLIRGRFHPGDGQLYLSGMYSWAGSQQEPGGFFRLRYTGKPVFLPGQLRARPRELMLGFTGDLDPDSVADVDNYQIQIWDLKRTKNYGSEHYNQRPLEVRGARIEGRDVFLEIPALQPTWGMEVRYTLRTAAGDTITGTIHNTIHRLHDAPAAKQSPGD
jgi:putative heme-binding domain-containing protein